MTDTQQTPAVVVASLLALARVKWGNIDTDANKVFTLAESMLSAGAFAPSEAAVSMIGSMADLIDGAIESHIYDTSNGDEIPDDCPYTLTVEEARTFIDAHGVLGPMPGAVQLIRDLRGTVADLTGQIDQMKGVFDDSDGAIQQAQDDADETDLMAKVYLDTLAAGPLRLNVTIEGGNVQAVWSAAPIPGLEFFVYDYDVTEEDEAVYEVELTPGVWTAARVDPYDLEVCPVPAQRERIEEDYDAEDAAREIDDMDMPGGFN